jgi:hypothetical protein
VSKGEDEGPTSGQVKNARAAFDEAHGDLPPIDFVTFVLSLYHQARVALGDAPDEGGKSSVDLPIARQNIDLILLLQERTKGNLNGEEERTIEQVLYDLRMRYVEVAKVK